MWCIGVLTVAVLLAMWFCKSTSEGMVSDGRPHRYIVARHPMIVDFHQYLYHLFDVARVRPVGVVNHTAYNRLRRHPTRVEWTCGGRHHTYCQFPDIFDDIILAYIDGTRLLTFPTTEPYRLDADLSLRDCVLTVGSTRILLRGVLMNSSFADIDTVTWNGDWHLDITDHSSYVYRIDDAIVDQGDAGTCGVVTLCAELSRYAGVRLSALFLYYTTRMIECADPTRDTGTVLVDSLIAVGRYGICTEEMWPYDLTKIPTRPSAAAFADAATRTRIRFDILRGETAIHRELLAGNRIVVDVSFPIGMFDEATALTGIVPERGVETPAYSHSVILTGVESGYIRFQNSYGKWGDGGYGMLPISYLHDGYIENCIVIRGTGGPG